MKIGIDGLFENIRTGTGGLTYLRQMISHLALLTKEKPEINYHIFVSPSSREIYSFPGVTLTTCGRYSEKRVGRIFAQQIAIPRMVSKLGFSALLCPGNVVSLFAKVPMVVVFQNRLQLESPPSLGWGRKIFRSVISTMSIRRAAVIVAVSKDLANYLIKSVEVPANKIKVVYEGIDWKFPMPYQQIHVPIRHPYILNVSTLFDYKNHETLIRAFALLIKNKAFKKFRLVIIGADWKKRKSCLQRLANQLGVGEFISFLGHVERSKLPGYYQNASVFVYPSLVESFGLPLLEAMSQTPVGCFRSYC